jgi:hypothetical protein
MQGRPFSPRSQQHYITGLPHALSEFELGEQQDQACDLIQDERSRTQQSSEQPKDPTGPAHEALTIHDLNAMRQQLPFLKDFSDAFLRANKPDCLIKMGATTLNMREDRLASNRATSYLVKEGFDNRETT